MAADIFDDIEDQDNDALPWRKVPAAQAINMASCVLILAFKALLAVKDPEHYRQLNAAFHQIGLQACDGQFQELRDEKQRPVTFDKYFETIRKKSGALTAGACKTGAILANGNDVMIRDFGEFGLKLGVISQIKNDLQDFLKFDTKSDFVQGRQTLPLVYLNHVLEGEKAQQLHDLRSLALQDRTKFGAGEQYQLRQLTVQEGAPHFCSVTCTLFKQEMTLLLDGMNISEEQKRKLINLAG